MKRVYFHTDDGRDAFVDITEYQYDKLKRERILNMDHCDLAMDSLEEFIGCVMAKYAVILNTRLVPSALEQRDAI